MEVMISKCQWKDKRGEVREYGDNEGLKCVYFNASSIVIKLINVGTRECLEWCCCGHYGNLDTRAVLPHLKYNVLK